MKTFPPELVDTTIDFLYDDVLVLLQCCQVCKTWVPTARYHLSAMRIAHFASGVADDAKTTRLVGLLSHPLSTLAPSVRRVRIGSMSKQSDLMLLMHKISPCAPVLRACRSLYLKAITWKDIDAASRIHFVSNFPNLTELLLSQIEYDALDDMANTLSSFPTLQRLHFDRVKWLCSSPPGGQSSSTTLLVPALKTLEIDYGCENLLQWLWLNGQKLPRLFSFHLKLSEILSENFAPTFAPALEHIEIAFYRLHLETLRNLTIDLSQNLTLRSIHISHLHLNELGSCVPDFRTQRIHVDWVPRLLATVTSPFIERLRLGVWISSVLDIDILDWGFLKEIFSRSDGQFLSLRNLLVEIFGKIYEKADREEIERRIYNGLTGCKAASVLEFRWY